MLRSPGRGSVIAATALAACAGRSESHAVAGAGAPATVIACRARVDRPLQFTEIALRDGRNLGTMRIADRTGIERGVRLHPDGTTVVFARQTDEGDPDSRELYSSSIDGSRAEMRLTDSAGRDEEPCWSPDGSNILFVSTRSGQACLWVLEVATGVATPFAVAPAEGDAAPDWSRATGRVVWSRRDNDGRQRLWIADANGGSAFPLTDPGPGTVGDQDPAFSPDGARVAFVRRTGADTALLAVVDVGTLVVAPLLQPAGDARMPRWTPSGGSVWFGLEEASAGRATLRLAAISAGGAPTLLWPDERWRLEGFDLAPGLEPAPASSPPVALDVTDAEIQIATGAAAFGVRPQLAAVDGSEFRIVTTTFDGREVAGINCRFDLPVPAATDLVELRIRAVARSTRDGGDSVLRMSIYNPVDERFDTAVEIPAASTARTMEFRTSSLRHVTIERQLRVTVIADLAPGAAADLLIDEVFVQCVPASR